MPRDSEDMAVERYSRVQDCCWRKNRREISDYASVDAPMKVKRRCRAHEFPVIVYFVSITAEHVHEELILVVKCVIETEAVNVVFIASCIRGDTEIILTESVTGHIGQRQVGEHIPRNAIDPVLRNDVSREWCSRIGGNTVSRSRSGAQRIVDCDPLPTGIQQS